MRAEEYRTSRCQVVSKAKELGEGGLAEMVARLQCSVGMKSKQCGILGEDSSSFLERLYLGVSTAPHNTMIQHMSDKF